MMIEIFIGVVISLGIVEVVLRAKSKNLNPQKIFDSPNFREGIFHNREPIVVQKDEEKGGFWTMLEVFSSKYTPKELPSIKNDLANLQKEQELLVWFGHSSFLLQTSSKRFLIDPILGSNASPLFFIKPFRGSDVYRIEDLGVIDYLLITHNHYDHLSKKTLKSFAKSPASKALQKAIVPLGVGKYLRDFGIDESKVIELDWDESLSLSENLTLHFLTTRHFSGRGLFDQNKSLWGSFLLQSQGKQIYMSGDSGYGEHFKEIGKIFGAIDLAILENGQYNKHWRNIHLFPNETLQAAQDLNAKALMPIIILNLNSLRTSETPRIRS